MGDTPAFNDRFARRSAPGAMGLAPAEDHFRKPGTGQTGDQLKARGKPDRSVKAEKLAKAPLASAPPRHDPFAQKSKSASPTPKPKPAMTAPLKDPFARAASPRAEPDQPPAKTTAARVAPIAAAASFYNPFGRPPPARSAKTPAHVESPRTPLHVVPAAPTQPASPAPKVSSKSRPAGRSSSLVLVSGASAVASAETLEAPPPPSVEKVPEPPAADPPPAPPKDVKPPGGGGGSGGPPRGGSTAKSAPGRLGFNQDDVFGVIFGVAVIIFLLLWLMRGRGVDSPVDDGLVGVQSAANQQVMAAAPPPAALVDPFGSAPVDLRPTGPLPEPLPEPDVAIASAAPPPAAAPAAPAVAATPVSPPPVAVAPSAPLAERKMNGWFCTASSRLTEASRSALESDLTTFADVFRDKELVVRGYADTRGSTEYNSLLGGERAKVVADFLRTKGLTVAEFSGVGELDGLDDNQNCSNQRRVDVWVKGGPAAAPSRECTPEPEAAKLVCG